jgi:hypothetical protein
MGTKGSEEGGSLSRISGGMDVEKGKGANSDQLGTSAAKFCDCSVGKAGQGGTDAIMASVVKGGGPGLVARGCCKGREVGKGADLLEKNQMRAGLLEKGKQAA